MMARSSWQMKVMRRSFCGRNEHYNGFERRVGAGHGVTYGMRHCKDTCISKTLSLHESIRRNSAAPYMCY